MSSLYRSAISARIAKLPQLPPSSEELDGADEIEDSLGSLPGGMGPPAMYVFADPNYSPHLNFYTIGLHKPLGLNANQGHPTRHSPRSLLRPSFLKPSKSPLHLLN
jgi:hypothetical protein